MQIRSERELWWSIWGRRNSTIEKGYGDEELILKQMCDRVAREVGDGATDEILARVRGMIDTLSAKQAAPKSGMRWPLAAAAAAAAVIVASVLFFWPREASMPFWVVGPEQTLGRLGEEITTLQDGEKSIVFKQESQLVLASETVVRVLHATSKSVTVRLEHGEVSATIEGNGFTEWKVVTDDYSVMVLGTKFTVSWDETAEIFHVKVKQGTVSVGGNEFAQKGIIESANKGIKVSTGYQLKIDRKSDLLALGVIGDHRFDWSEGLSDNEDLLAVNLAETGGSSISDVTPQNSTPHLPKRTAPLEKREPTKRTEKKKPSNQWNRTPVDINDIGLELDSESKPSTTEEDAWLEYYKKGHYQQALNAAEQIGINVLVSRLDLEKLWKLMRAAREEGRYHTAQSVLLACRKRFADTQKAEISAFILGKIYYENTGDMESAIRWFSTYLKESPSGRLAEEAEARIISALSLLGKEDAAKQAAIEYLSKHPHGIFQEDAQTLIDE